MSDMDKCFRRYELCFSDLDLSLVKMEKIKKFLYSIDWKYERGEGGSIEDCEGG